MSSNSIEATQLPSFQTMQIQSTSKSKAVFVDLFLQLPIQLFGRRPSYSARSLSQQAASVSITFPRVLSSAIGLYALRSEQSSLLGFQRTIVQAARNLSRKQLTLRTIVIKAYNALTNGSLIACKNLFRILSVLGHLFSFIFYTIA